MGTGHDGLMRPKQMGRTICCHSMQQTHATRGTAQGLEETISLLPKAIFSSKREVGYIYIPMKQTEIVLLLKTTASGPTHRSSQEVFFFFNLAYTTLKSINIGKCKWFIYHSMTQIVLKK